MKLDAVNLLGNTPLHVACHNGQDVCVNELLVYGAKVNATNKQGQVENQ